MIQKLKKLKYGILAYKAKKSYAQQGEDLIVKFVFDHLGIQKPSYLDIGAHHPYYLSNTALLYKYGSRGINIEPNPELIKNFKLHRKNDINLNIGITDIEASLDFFIMSESTMSTFSKKEALRIDNETRIKIKKTITVPTFPVKNIINQYYNSIFPDFLSIDVEGLEHIILETIDFEHSFPKVICLETMTYSESGQEMKRTDLIDYLIKKGYFVYADTYTNTIFIKKSIWEKRFDKN